MSGEPAYIPIVVDLQADAERTLASQDFALELADTVAERHARLNRVTMTWEQFSGLKQRHDALLRQVKLTRKQTRLEVCAQVAFVLFSIGVFLFIAFAVGWAEHQAHEQVIALSCTHCTCPHANVDHASPYWEQVLIMQDAARVHEFHAEQCTCTCSVRTYNYLHEDSDYQLLTLPFNATLAAGAA